MHHALNPDPYRGAFGNDGPRYAADVSDLIASATPGRVAAFTAETIQGVGGALPLADGYLPAVYKARRWEGWGRWGAALRRESGGGAAPSLRSLHCLRRISTALPSSPAPLLPPRPLLLFLSPALSNPSKKAKEP